MYISCPRIFARRSAEPRATGGRCRFWSCLLFVCEENPMQQRTGGAFAHTCAGGNGRAGARFARIFARLGSPLGQGKAISRTDEISSAPQCACSLHHNPGACGARGPVARMHFRLVVAQPVGHLMRRGAAAWILGCLSRSGCHQTRWSGPGRPLRMARSARSFAYAEDRSPGKGTQGPEQCRPRPHTLGGMNGRRFGMDFCRGHPPRTLAKGPCQGSLPGPRGGNRDEEGPALVPPAMLR